MFKLTLGELVAVSLIVVIVFGGMKLPGLRETFLQDAEARSVPGRRPRIDWFLVGAALVFGALMLLLVSYVPRR